MAKKAACLALVLLAGLVSGAEAHHSLSFFDREKTVTLSGVVKSFEWSSPHVMISVVTEDGAEIRPNHVTHVWSIESGSPNLLARTGWSSHMMKRGDRVSLAIHPRRDGKSGGYLADEIPLTVNGRLLAGIQAFKD